MASLDLRRKTLNRQEPESTISLPHLSIHRAFATTLLFFALCAVAIYAWVGRLTAPSALPVYSVLVIALAMHALLCFGQERASTVVAVFGLTFIVIAARFMLTGQSEIWRLSVAAFPLIIIAAFALSPGHGWRVALLNIAGIAFDAWARANTHQMLPQSLLIDTGIVGLIYACSAATAHAGANTFEKMLAEVRTSKRTIAYRNQLLERQVRERDALEGRQAELAKDMRAVLSAANELLLCKTVDDVWRNAVEFAQHRLGVERCAFYVFTDENTTLRGTFGVDPVGKVRNEAHITINATEQKWFGVFNSQNAERPAWVLIETPQNDDNRHLQPAWTAATIIRAHSGAWLGVMYNDTLISNRPFDPAKQDVIAVYTSLVASIARQKQLENEIHSHASQLATTAERSRIARELHDSVSQALFGIVLGSRTAIQYNQTAEANQPLDYVLSLAESALVDIRALIFELRPESLSLEGLIPALRKQLDAHLSRHKIDLIIESESEPPLTLEAREAFYRALTEAAQNIIKHARATQVKVTFTHLADEKIVRAVIDDNGVGFDAGRAFEGHYGLINMQERMKRLNGTCEFVSAPGVGTSVILTLPAAATQPESA